MKYEWLVKDDIVGRKRWRRKLESIKADDNFSVVENGFMKYINIPVSFDIETSSFYSGEVKKAIMYIWSANINGHTFIGRTWDDFVELLDMCHDVFELGLHKRMMFWIHNIEYEFQFMHKWLQFVQVFSDDARKPFYAITNNGIEFRCSYKLSGYSLAKLGEQLNDYKTTKMVGDLDYSLLRTPRTGLTKKEFKYVIQDTKVVVCYIQEQIEKEGDISKIPYTRTGYVRRYCREKTVGALHYDDAPIMKQWAWQYHNLMSTLTLTYNEYLSCKRGFQGGFTHANANYVGKTVRNVQSEDFTSSYPAIIVLKYMPMSKPFAVYPENVSQLTFYLEKYCCLMTVRFNGLVQTNRNESPISLSRCWDVKYPVINNGRIVNAGTLTTTITELDFDTISKYYIWDSMDISEVLCFRRGYLPTDFVKSVLDLYKMKTELKGVEGEEVEYLVKKGMLNATFGMMVTDIVRSDIEYYNGGWVAGGDLPKSQIERYNKSYNRFLYYPWGVWVTAHARHNLFTAITECGSDYIYSDTDSVKILNYDKHKKYFEDYNNAIYKDIERAAAWHKVPVDMFIPKTIKGVEKPIGVWDDDGTYDRFKTLGAKRYLVEKDGKLQFTVAGIKKASILNYMRETYGGNDEIFENFDDQLDIPAEYTGKLTHTYVDNEIDGYVADYKGDVSYFHEKSYIHMEPAPFHLNIVDEFKDYLRGIQSMEY